MTTIDQGSGFTVVFGKRLQAHVVRAEAGYLPSEHGGTPRRVRASVRNLCDRFDECGVTNRIPRSAASGSLGARRVVRRGCRVWPLSRHADKLCEDFRLGFGAHLDPKAALIRALTEMNQLLATVIDSDGEYGRPDPDGGHWWRAATSARPAVSAARSRGSGARLADYEHNPTTDRTRTSP